MVGGLGMWEIILIFLVVLLLFGAKRLPEIGSSLGKGIREFKSSVREIEREINAPPEREPLAEGGGSANDAAAGEHDVSARPEEESSGGEPRRLRTEEG